MKLRTSNVYTSLPCYLHKSCCKNKFTEYDNFHLRGFVVVVEVVVTFVVVVVSSVVVVVSAVVVAK